MLKCFVKRLTITELKRKTLNLRCDFHQLVGREPIPLIYSWENLNRLEGKLELMRYYISDILQLSQ